jgi:hypothetical protein
VTIDADAARGYSAEITELDNSHVLRYGLFDDGAPLTWSDVLDRWKNDRSFRRFFISLLVDAPYTAYFWETPPVTISTITRAFEFVLVESRQLAGVHSDQQAFANHFAAARAGESVIVFSNLGGDATLVVPCPFGPQTAYSQIAEFARHAPADQQQQLWAIVGATLERQIGARPIWLSTSGLGVYWLHIRLDSTPKYYTHHPYRDA